MLIIILLLIIVCIIPANTLSTTLIRTPTSVSSQLNGKVIFQQAEKTRSKYISDNSDENIPSLSITYTDALQALRTYHTEHGHVILPRNMVVSDDDSKYPASLHGKKLDHIIYSMAWWNQHIKGRPDRVKELNELGFIWTRLQNEWNLILEALVVYVSLNGDTIVPAKFVVPYSNEDWPKATWGIPLGNCISRIRLRGDYLSGHPDRIRQLNNLKFIWDLKEYMFEKLMLGLRHYKEHYVFSGVGRDRPDVLKVPCSFVVPKGKEHGWPKELWGFPLGAKCVAVRQKQLYVKDHPERIMALQQLGFKLNGNAELGWLQTAHAAAIYSNLHNRKLSVPHTFIVPRPPDDFEKGTWPWPPYLWGFPLGTRLKDIRTANLYLKGKHAKARRAQLDSLGMVWHPKVGRRPKVSQAGADDEAKLKESSNATHPQDDSIFNLNRNILFEKSQRNESIL